MIFIYALTCPDSGEIRYIGKSTRPKERLRNHINEKSKCHRCNWIQSLVSVGKEPGLTILQTLSDDADWQSWERSWIAHGKTCGWPLTNNTDGGDGVTGLPPESRARIVQAWIGRKHKPETIAKLIEARKKRFCSDETRAKYSQRFKGRAITWKDKIAESNRKLTDTQLQECKRELDAGILGIELSKKYGVHRTTISKIKMGTYKKSRNTS